MGVDCKIRLPGDVRVWDVAHVLGALAGLPRTEKTTESNGVTYTYSKTEGVTVQTTAFAEMAQILLKGEMVDGKTEHQVYFHFEATGGNARCLNPPSTPFWIAVGRGLVDFFGGAVDYSDCDDVRIDYEKPPQGPNCPEDGPEWQAFQDRMREIQPLTKKHLAHNYPHATYK